MNNVKYTPSQLVEIGRLSKSNDFIYRKLCQTIDSLEIKHESDNVSTVYTENRSKRKTHRGKRSKQIKRNALASKIQTGVNKSNLVYINTNRNTTNKKQLFNAGIFNARSIRTKETVIADFVIENDLDCLFLTETWLDNESETEIGFLKPNGYDFAHVPRQNGRGGGVGILFKSNLKFKNLNVQSTDSFEIIAGTIFLKEIALKVYNVYRPPPNSKNKFTENQFLEEFSDFLTSVSIEENTVIIGDFNIHVDQPSRKVSKDFNSLLSNCGLEQHVNVPTHTGGIH